MKVLWLCNVMLPVIAVHLGLESSSKEGWLSGMADAVLAEGGRNGIRLSVAFPLPPGAQPSQGEMPGFVCSASQSGICRGTVEEGGTSLAYYGFWEDTAHPDKYDEKLEPLMEQIVSLVQPDVVHCFGTEYPHTVAMCRIFPDKNRLLVGIQGLCSLLAEAYYGDLPDRAVRRLTFRDLVKRDSIRQQKRKLARRGDGEREAIRKAGNITGRTDWDRSSTRAWNPEAAYYIMNESLRREFYGPVWREEDCIPHSVFLSQGDYPIKGLHYMLLALPGILEKYSDAKVFVAGNSIVEYKTLKQKLKISAYGKYLRQLITRFRLEDHVEFLGMLDAEQMRDRYLKSSLFVCCSVLENSPNSLGEAMLLGMPCVCGDVGGIPSMFREGIDGIMYKGYSAAGEPEGVAGCLGDAVRQMWDNPEKMRQYCRNARTHAMETHDREKNYQRLVEIYGKICGKEL